MTKLTLLIPLGAVALVVLAVLVEGLYVKFAGDVVPVPVIPRSLPTQGSGTPLTYVVMGDSTAVSQGSEYASGYAVASTKHLARTYRVTMYNTARSGATTQMVVEQQLAQAAAHKPDLVLLAVGANDATKFTKGHTITSSLQHIVDELHRANPTVKIVVTRSPAMDSVSRFPFFSKWLMGLRTRQVNAAFATSITANHLTLAPIAERTRQAFLDDPTLTAADKFHPNVRGYALWIPVINDSLDRALAE